MVRGVHDTHCTRVSNHTVVENGQQMVLRILFDRDKSKSASVREERKGKERKEMCVHAVQIESMGSFPIESLSRRRNQQPPLEGFNIVNIRVRREKMDALPSRRVNNERSTLKLSVLFAVSAAVYWRALSKQIASV